MLFTCRLGNVDLERPVGEFPLPSAHTGPSDSIIASSAKADRADACLRRRPAAEEGAGRHADDHGGDAHGAADAAAAGTGALQTC